MKKFLTLTIIAIIALIGLSVSVNAADVATEADLKAALLTDGTVKLTGNIEITESIKTSKNVTLDLNGFRITGPDDGVANWYAFIVEGGTFTLKDSSAAQTGEIYAKCYGIETKAGTFIMESGKITATKNATIGAAIVNFGGKVEIKGGTLIAAVWAIDVESYFTDAEVIISGGTFETTTTDGNTVQIGGGLSKNKETALISGGTFKGTNAFAVDPNADTEVSITGGIFDIDVSEYLSEDVKVEKDENGDYVVYEKHSIVVEPSEGGKITVDKDLAFAGEKITVTVTPDKDYKFAKITIDFGGIGATIPGDEFEGNFEMEDADATITAVFEKVELKGETTTGGQGEAEQQPTEESKEEKDETPKTGSVDIVLFASVIIAVISVAGIVTVKKYTR